MSIWTLTELDEQIAAFKAALLKVASGQSCQIGGDTYTRADIEKIQNILEYLNQQKLALTKSGGPRLQPGRVLR